MAMTPATIKPKPQTITIPVLVCDQTTHTNTTTHRDIKATVYGPLAIHRGITISDSWTITHMPTGKYLYGFASVVDARAAVREMLALPIDWFSLTPFDGVEPEVMTRLRKALW